MREAAIREAALAAEAAERAEQERRQVGAVVPRSDLPASRGLLLCWQDVFLEQSASLLPKVWFAR